MKHTKFKANAVSLMLAASMTVPAFMQPAIIFAEDFSETASDQPQTAANEDAEMAAYAEDNGIDLQSDVTGNEKIQINLANTVSSDLTTPVYPWAQTTALETQTDKTGFVTVSLNFDDLLKNVPTIFDSQIGWWSKAKQWRSHPKSTARLSTACPST